MATMDELIEEILAEYELRFIFDQPIPEDKERRLPRPLRAQRPFTDLDDQVPSSVRLPADHGSRFLTTPKMSLRLTATVQSFLLAGWKKMTHLTLVTSRSPTACMPEPADWPLNARMTDVRAIQLLAALQEGNFILRLKFLREKDDDWVLEDKFDPVRAERKKGQGIIEISRDTKPGVLTELTACSTQMPTLSPQLPTASTPSETRTLPTLLR